MRPTLAAPPVPGWPERATRPDPGGASALTVPASALPHRSPAELLTLARRGLAEATCQEQVGQRSDGLRYATA
ncbi:MAG: hypothetical protein J2P15_23270, partial [Micromonosporaceae bacterium]|nr:hypothetical protein [Micromonosporaceae bacterium]